MVCFGLCWCIYRDIQLEKQQPGDLRNRVVGARLQMDGHSPYFYNWQPADGLRYYDPQNFSALPISNVTATPLFHQLLYPIANLPQRTISRLWLALQYLAFGFMIMLVWRMCPDRRTQWAVSLTAFLFLFTQAWTKHISQGQLYIFLALGTTAFYYFLTRSQTNFNSGLAGIVAACLLLVRPNMIVFLIPFILLISNFSKKYLSVFFTSFAVIILLAFISGTSRVYWSDYRKSITEHIRIHQGAPKVHIASATDPQFQYWEGWDMNQVKIDGESFNYPGNGESGNIFVVVKEFFGIKLPLWLLNVSCIAVMFFILALVCKQRFVKRSLDIHIVALTAFCLYMTSDIFSPVHRFTYNSVQWAFPLLLIASQPTSLYKRKFIIGLITGLLLQSVPVKLLPMQLTIGEYLVYACIIGILVTSKPLPKE